MSEHKFYYYFDRYNNEDPSNFEKHNCYEVTFHKLHNEWDYEDLAEECARDFFYEHDGWEYRDWQGNERFFFLYKEDMTFLGKYSVSMDIEPVFMASRDE